MPGKWGGARRARPPLDPPMVCLMLLMDVSCVHGMRINIQPEMCGVRGTGYSKKDSRANFCCFRDVKFLLVIKHKGTTD